MRIQDSKIVPDEGHSAIPLLRESAIRSTREYLKSEIDRVTNLLIKSNLDPKFQEVFSKLRSLVEFEDDAGAISLGLHARMVSNMLPPLEEEISALLFMQVSAVVIGISSFASQYRDWIDFTQNALNYPPKMNWKRT